MALRIDLVDGAEVVDRGNLYEARRTAVIDGFDSDGDFPSHERIFQAMNMPGVPQMWEAHPSIIFFGIRPVVLERTARAISTHIIHVELIYKVPDPLEYETEPNEETPVMLTLGATLRETQSNLDINGSTTFVSYGQKLQGGTYAKQEPLISFRLSRMEPYTTLPGDKARNFVRKINGDDFVGDPPGTWMCTSIEATSQDGGLTYLVTYEFQRLGVTPVNPPGGGDPVIFEADFVLLTYIEPETGRPPNDAELGNGITPWQVYERANFAELNLGI